jgi:SAM-dependent methyltransferase
VTDLAAIPSATHPQYVFDNSWRDELARLEAAQQLLDPGTLRQIDALGARPGWHCLEAGAGAGSVAVWLSDKVGAQGHVTATDIETRFLQAEGRPNLDVRRHDLRYDELPADEFDLVHARLVLEHLPKRDHVLSRLVRALRPGGWLLIEAIDYVSGAPISQRGSDLFARTLHERLELMREAGLDPYYGRKLPAELRARGLLEAGAEGRAWIMEGGSVAARWFRFSMAQLRDRLSSSGRLSAAEIDEMLDLFEDPEFAAWTPVIVSSWGRRPEVANV